MRPLNGEKTHPLSAKAKEVLADICCNPVPRQQINPGIVNRLLRGKLVREIYLKSPYAAHKGGTCVHLEATAAGKRVGFQ